MTEWTTEMRKTIDNLMNTECGELWWDANLTEQILNNCCIKCPFATQCHTEEGFCYGCSVWEEKMGEDL